MSFVCKNISVIWPTLLLSPVFWLLLCFRQLLGLQFWSSFDEIWLRLYQEYYYYYYYLKKRFRWRNVKRLQGLRTNVKNSDKTRLRRERANRVTVRCGRRQSCRDQESFWQTVSSSTDASLCRHACFLPKYACHASIGGKHWHFTFLSITNRFWCPLIVCYLKFRTAAALFKRFIMRNMFKPRNLLIGICYTASYIYHSHGWDNSSSNYYADLVWR